MSDGKITLERLGFIARLTIAHPQKRNAMTQAMWRSLPALASAIAAEPGARVVLLQGAEGHFSAGADIDELKDVFATPSNIRAYNALVQQALISLQRLDRPVIASVEGVCFGGGVSLAMQCDLVFASKEARFGITPAKLGLVYGHADTTRLCQRLGSARAKDLLFSGRTVAAGEALAIGLIDRLAASPVPHETAEAYAAELAALSQTSIRLQKRLIDGLSAGKADPATFAAATEEAAAGADFAEGRNAFLSRRKPDFPSRS